MISKIKSLSVMIAMVALAGNSFGVQWQQRGYRGGNQLTGTYRLDASRSDDVPAVAERATGGLTGRERERVRNLIVRRVDSPEQLAIERRGRTVTIASTLAPRATFEADGRDQVETRPNGRQMRVRASLLGDQLELSYTGDRLNDYYVTMDPIENGRRLRVTRRFNIERLNNQITVQSIYDKTAQVAELDLYRGDELNSDAAAAGRPSGGWAIADGTRITARLDQNLSTEEARPGDRFTLQVQSPGEYRGAVIEGSVLSVDRSGRISGRSDMSLDFQRIRLRDGRGYNFAGNIEEIRTPEGESVRVDNEGKVEEGDSQTNRTITRTGIGGAIGAVIGAIAGGGKGAAIGAAIGAGAGAGSVIVQGRDDLTLTSGSEFTIRASAPRY